MANIAKTYTFVNGQPADATQVNKNFDDIIAGVGDISVAGHALIDDASAAAQLTTLGTAAYSEGTWTPVLYSFTIVGSVPALIGTYKRIGNLMFIECIISAGAGGNTSVACAGGTSNIRGFPAAATTAPCMVALYNSSGLVTGLIQAGGVIYPPAFSAVSQPVYLTAVYAV